MPALAWLFPGRARRGLFFRWRCRPPLNSRAIAPSSAMPAENQSGQLQTFLPRQRARWPSAFAPVSCTTGNTFSHWMALLAMAVLREPVPTCSGSCRSKRRGISAGPICGARSPNRILAVWRVSFLRVWNLRRGDDDDNRSSPYGGGFRSLVIPTLLEFNYLKAPLAFLALVIGPAILVGIAPSVVVTYGRLAYHTLTLAGTNLAVALGLFVLLLGTALWIARPLLRKAFVDFRYLHYALVFPIFVALREVLRTVTERFAGSSITPEQLGR